MPIIQELSDFLKIDRDELLIDARSEAEHKHGHIPGAFNIPLLNNEERRLIGIIYKREGREQAVIKGFELTSHKFADHIKTALKHSESKKVKVYCARGGMRSNILAWLLSMAGFKVSVLKGGYKTFRNWVLAKCDEDRNMVILGGRTGSGKTEIIQLLQKKGEQVVDLEGLANHKGSAFGALGMPEQPGYEHFENLLAMELDKFDKTKPLWLENESRLIGPVKIPDKFYDDMRKAPVVEVSIPKELRIERLAKEYGSFPKDLLAENTRKLEKRLGNLRTRQAIEKLYEGDIKGWIEEVLNYYDKTYQYGKEQRDPQRVRIIELENDSFENSVDQILAAVMIH